MLGTTFRRSIRVLWDLEWRIFSVFVVQRVINAGIIPNKALPEWLTASINNCQNYIWEGLSLAHSAFSFVWVIIHIPLTIFGIFDNSRYNYGMNDEKGPASVPTVQQPRFQLTNQIQIDFNQYPCTYKRVLISSSPGGWLSNTKLSWHKYLRGTTV